MEGVREKMGKVIKANSLVLYFVISILFMDIIFRVLINENHFIFDFVIILSIFPPGLCVFILLICSFFNGVTKFHYFNCIAWINHYNLFSQFIYFKFFKTFYTFYSVGNGAQVFEFWKDIVNLLIKHSFGFYYYFSL